MRGREGESKIEQKRDGKREREREQEQVRDRESVRKLERGSGHES